MEQRLIDADALLSKGHFVVRTNDFGEQFVTVEEINKMPTVDAVPVTRCAQCKWCEYPAHNSTKYGCKLFDRCVKPDWFCADGERRNDEQQT